MATKKDFLEECINIFENKKYYFSLEKSCNLYKMEQSIIAVTVTSDMMNEFIQEFATYTKYYQDQFVNIYEHVLKPEARVSLNCRSCITRVRTTL